MKVTTRHLKYFIILLLGTIFSVYLFYSINDKYVVRNNSLVETSTAKVEIKLLNELDKINLAMESMEVFIKNSDSLYSPTFKELTTPFLEDLNGILLLGWKSESGNKKTAGYLVHQNHYLDSIKINKADLFKNIHESLIERAVQSRKTVFSERNKQFFESQSSKGYISMMAVYDSIGVNLKGVSFGVFDMERWVKETLKYELPILDITIRDKNTSEVPLFAENSYSDLVDVVPQFLNLNAGDRIWEVAVVPKPVFVGYPHSYESYFMLLLGIFSSFLLVVVLRQRDDYLTRLSQEVWNRTKELEESNNLKETLIREIHHRVKNNLQIASSLMNLQKRRFTDPEMVDAFTNSQGRISAIALIHEKIYEHKDAKAVDLKSYLIVLMEYHQKISPLVEYEIDCPTNLTIDLDTAVPIALITSELVVNVLKHAFTIETSNNCLVIGVENRSDDIIELSIHDNGIGLPDNFDINSTKGLGFEIVKKLCRQIDAKISFHCDENGTTFGILFKQ